MTFTYRNPKESDLDLITSIMNQSRKETAYHRDITTAEVNAETFDDPDYKTEGVWLAFDGDEATAYVIAVIEQGRLDAGLDDGWVEIDVIPEKRGLGAEEELTDLAVGYLKARGVGKAIARAETAEGWKQQLFLKAGFESVRHFYRLAQRSTIDIPNLNMPPGIVVSHRMLKDLSDDEVGEFAEVVNDTFAEHFDFAPEPAWRWIKWRDACEDPWMISLAKSGSRNVAICIAEDSQVYNKERGLRSGWINVLGVRKDLRGRGIGAAMLVDGMEWLRSLGHDTIHIGVDAENEKALGLYKSVGFEVENESQVYHLGLRA